MNKPQLIEPRTLKGFRDHLPAQALARERILDTARRLGLDGVLQRNADQLSFAETEAAIAAYGEKARKNSIGVDEMRGGTFTVSNGGIFGSMMSTPILNPPQVAECGVFHHQKSRKP